MRVKKTKAAVVLILAECVTAAWADHRAWTRIDPWFRPPPSQWSTNASLLDPRHVIAVSAEKRGIAEAMLTNTPAKPHTPEEASNLAGADVSLDPHLSLYLLRTVYLGDGTGGFNVNRAGTAVEVHHTSLGRRAVPMKRAAVIAQLNTLPTEVYVTCSMAE